MTTAKDLFLTAMEPGPGRSVGQGDLSLALAGAELIDLIGAGAVTVDGDRVVPGGAWAPDDPLLRQAVAEVGRQASPEPIEDWLWRRGRNLSATYQEALEADGELTRKRDRRSPFGAGHVEPADTPARVRAADRRREGEPVLAALASAVGIGEGHSGGSDDGTETSTGGDGDGDGDGDGTDIDIDGPVDGGPVDGGPDLGDDAVTAVVAGVHDAVMELEAVRQRRAIEGSAFANLWRGV
ncbi:GPP34 family phosphoprotein [Streptomyces sp. NPDC091278]|uniref:GOLPH3/VPS74 family protein n=1 Tax=unclassified Streptomyces TaxID=2593676 RepID=UPI00344C427A